MFVDLLYNHNYMLHRYITINTFFGILILYYYLPIHETIKQDHGIKTSMRSLKFAPHSSSSWHHKLGITFSFTANKLDISNVH